MSKRLIEVKDLSIQFRSERSWVTAVSRVSFHIGAGETVGLVGESGCGKSVSSLAIMGLLPDRRTCRAQGEILYEGRDLFSCDRESMRRIRGNRISMIFQEPMTCLNPVVPVGKQIAEAIRLHNRPDRREIDARVVSLLAMVGIPDPKGAAKRYPFELSGGMRQRVMIAMVMSCSPQLLIADEPTTALDVTIQAQILDLIRGMKEKSGAATLMITHDLGVIADICERVIIMYAGQVVEEAEKFELFDHPAHPYTAALLKSIPSLSNKGKKLYSIRGSVPSPGSIEKGCVFAPRCSLAKPRCLAERPELRDIAGGHLCRCWEVD
ncbi:MAG: Oligopeptide transport ATP-binding protein OppD [Firmicutes bacterium ADurb.Bin248]|jgi:peptide/nickel transport system ATP-binding protein|nr:MAG: Oligopeptide transport ATP-binding protein OppD [Firmicutes bacterium ADurb.Bin248]HOF99699.1 ABC transporter ATP-binding protein [Clostridia bacterium]HPK15492.1 ABC transporter ATP-binding protein [Clostridia bacterium]